MAAALRIEQTTGCRWRRDPLRPRKDNRDNLVRVAPSGFMAGIWAKSDVTIGVHRAPANWKIKQAGLNDEQVFASTVTLMVGVDRRGEIA